MSHYGIVKWFDYRYGYGFLFDDTTHKEIYMHFLGHNMDNFSYLTSNQKVIFDITKDVKIPQAINVTAVDVQPTHRIICRHIEMKLLGNKYAYESCYFEGDTIYLCYPDNRCIKFNCRTGESTNINNIAKHIIKNAGLYSESMQPKRRRGTEPQRNKNARLYSESMQIKVYGGIKQAKVYGGTIQDDFINTIISLYQFVNGHNKSLGTKTALDSFLYQANERFIGFNIRMWMSGHSLQFTYNGQFIPLEAAACLILYAKQKKMSSAMNNPFPSNIKQNTSCRHIEIKLEEDIFMFNSCYFKDDTAYLHFISHGYIKVNCPTGSYSETNNITQDVPKCVTAARGTTLEGFVNCIVVFYQIVSGRNYFSSVENVLNSFPYQANNAFKEYSLKMNMTRKSLTFTHNGRPVSLEEAARILVSEPQKQNQIKKLSIMEEWSVIRYNMKQEVSDNYGFVIPADTTHFSATTYICPECGNHISKVLLPEDTVIALTGGKGMKINKAFACKHCNNFFAPFANGRLDSGIIAYLKVNSQRFNEIIQMMDDNYRLPDSY